MSLRIAGGAVFFNRKIGSDYQGQIKFGSTQGLALTSETTKLPSYNNDDTGIGVKEADVVTQQEQTGTLRLRNITAEELAIAFGADAITTRSQSAGALAETITNVKQGRYYRLGIAAGFPTGARDLSAVTVEVAAAAKTGFTVDLDVGLLYIVPGGDIADGDDIDVAATLAAVTWDVVISGDAEAAGELWVVGKNATGDPLDHYMPSVTLSLEGEYQVKSDPENPNYLELSLGVSVLADTARGLAPVYIDGRPAA